MTDAPGVDIDGPVDDLLGQDARPAATLSTAQRLDPILRRAANFTSIALFGYAALQLTFPAPAGVIVQGVIVGGLTAMVSFGLAMVYKANRIINFAQADLGAVPAAFAVALMTKRPEGVLGQIPGTYIGIPYIVALPFALGSALLLGFLVERLVIRRFSKAPRLILMVVTIGLAQILAGLASAIPAALGRSSLTTVSKFDSPFALDIIISPITFHANELIGLVSIAGVCIGLYALLQRTNIGVAIRACAQNADRAALLGINVGRVQSVVWILAAGLAAVATFMRGGILGLPLGSAFGPSILLRALAAAVIGRMENYAVMFFAAAGLGVIEMSIIWDRGSARLIDPVLFALLLGTLLVQRRRKDASRADDQATASWRQAALVRPIPAELARLPEVRWGGRALGAMLLASVLLLPAVLSISQVNLGAAVFIYAILAVSLVILTGWAGEMSLGQVGFFAIGAIVSGSLNAHHHLDLSLTLLAAALVGAACAVAIGLPALRIRGLFLAVTTLAFAMAVSAVALDPDYVGFLPDATSEPIHRLPLFGRADVHSETAFYYVCLAVLLVVLWLVRGMQRTRVARVLIASRDNPNAAQSFGLSLRRAKLTAFAVSGFFASMSGGLFVIHQQAIGIQPYAPVESIRALTMAVVGGLGSVPGALLGTVFVKSTEWFNTLVPDNLQFLFTFAGSGVGLVFVLLVLPGGLGAVLYRTRDRILREVANRRGLIVASLVADAPDPRGADEVPDVLQEPDAVGGEPELVDGSSKGRRRDHQSVVRGEPVDQVGGLTE